MKHQIEHLKVRLMTVLLTIVAIISCSKSDEYSFKTPQEAINACRLTFYDLQNTKPHDMEKLAGKTASWLELQDTVYNFLLNDSTVNDSSVVTAQYFDVCDSIRNIIVNLALAEKRTMKDVLDFKLGTASKKDVRKTDAYKEALKYYQGLDKVKIAYPDAETVYQNYIGYLTREKPFTTVNQLLEFIAQEDILFQQLLHVITDVPQERLQRLTDKTGSLVDRLYGSTVTNLDNEISERVLIYLTMRYNRRIIQNAEKCYGDIRANVKLSDQQAANYRWMILQPYMSIDNYAMSLITDKQKETLVAISEKLPALMAYLDDRNFKPSKEESEKLMEVMVTYFLNTYIKMIL